SAATAGKKRISKGFAVTDAMVAEFKQSLQEQKVRIEEDSWNKDIAFIKAMLKYEIDDALFGVNERQKNLIASDPQAQFALAQWADALKLTELTKARAGSKGGH